MKILLFITLVGITALSLVSAGAAPKERKIPDYLREPLRDLHAQCVTETGVNEDHLKVCLDRIVPDLAEVKCYIHCLIEKTHLYDDNGQIDFKRVRYMVPTDVWVILEHLQKECGHIREDENCETAYQAAKCFFDKHEDVIEFCHLLVFDYQLD